jgi:DNA-binding NarL/FixJ family response regulator
MREDMSSSNITILGKREICRKSLAKYLEEWARLRHVIIREGESACAEILGDPAEGGLVIVDCGGDKQLVPTSQMLRSLGFHRPIVVMDDHAEPTEVSLAFAQGAVAFILTTMDQQTFFAALDFLLRGGTYVPPSVLNAIEKRELTPTRAPAIPILSCARSIEPEADHPYAADDDDGPSGGDISDYFGEGCLAFVSRLTRRQRDVLQRLCVGRSNKEIARDLDMSEATVKVHVRQVMRKLGAQNRTQVALIALSRGRTGQTSAHVAVAASISSDTRPYAPRSAQSDPSDCHWLRV